MNEKFNYIPALTGLRFIAFILIFNIHLFNVFNEVNYHTTNTFLISLCEMLRRAYIGVDLFFILSGFLIYNMIKNYSSFKHFFKRRFLRIYPIVIISTLPLIVDMDMYQVFDNFTLLMIFNSKLINYVNWSLCYEVYFYILFGLVFFLFNKPQNKVLYLSIIIIFSLLSYRYIYNYDPVRFMAFIWGVSIGHLNNHQGEKQQKIVQVLSKIGVFFIPILFAFLYIRASYSIQHTNRIIYYLLFHFFGGTLILSLIHRKYYLSLLLKNKYWVKLGKMSYALYIVHAIYGVEFAIKATESMGHSFTKVLISWVIAFLFSLILAFILHHFVEKVFYKETR